jgi:hypothetical protein
MEIRKRHKLAVELQKVKYISHLSALFRIQTGRGTKSNNCGETLVEDIII